MLVLLIYQSSNHVYIDQPNDDVQVEDAVGSDMVTPIREDDSASEMKKSKKIKFVTVSIILTTILIITLTFFFNRLFKVRR